MSKYKLRRHGIFEDDTNTGAADSANAAKANAAEQKIAALKTQYMQVQQQIQQKTRQYQADVANLKNKMLIIASQISDAGGDIIDTKQAANENFRSQYSLSKNLFESLQANKAEELRDIIISTFTELPQLSYFMDEKSAFTFARRLLTWINEQSWNDGEDHSIELGDRINMYLNGNSVSMSKREVSDFIVKFLEILKNNTVFNWIFGRDVRKYNFNRNYNNGNFNNLEN